MLICLLPLRCLLLASSSLPPSISSFVAPSLPSSSALFPSLSFSAASAPPSSFFAPSFPPTSVPVFSSFGGSFRAFYVSRCSSLFSSFVSSYCSSSFYLSFWSVAFLCSSSFFPSCSSCLVFSSRSFCSFCCSFLFHFLSTRSTTCSCFPSSFFFFFLFGCLVFLFCSGFRCFSGSLVRFVFGVSVVGALVFPFWCLDFLSFVASFFPHLSADASRDFSSGSSLFLSALCSLASAPLFAPPPSSGAPVFPPVSLP